MKLKLLIALIFSLTLIKLASAHMGEAEFTLVNDQSTRGNPAGGLDAAIPLDLASADYLPGQSIKFAVNQAVLTIPNAYRWQFADNQEVDGPTATRSFDQVGSKMVKLSAQTAPDAEFTIINTIGFNIKPKRDYRLPEARIQVTADKITRETFKVTMKAEPTVDQSARLAKITWLFERGQTAEGPSVTHTYKTSPVGYSPWVRITDSNGLVKDLTFNLAVQQGKLIVEDNRDQPGVIVKSNLPAAKRWAGLGLFGLAVLGLIVILKRR